MIRNRIVDDYVLRIKRELYGIDSRSSRSIVEELENHIHEKSMDMAAERDLQEPDDGLFREVIDELGPPSDVVVEYLKVLPKKLGAGLKLFLLLQMIIGIMAVIISVDQFHSSYVIGTGEHYDGTYLLSMVFVGITLLFMGVATMGLVIVQFRTPKNINHYGVGSVMLSVILAAGILLVMARFTLWRHTDMSGDDELFYAYFTPLFMLLMVVYIWGLRASEELKRRFILEEYDNSDFASKKKKSRKVMATVVIVSLILITVVTAGMYSYSSEITRKEILVNTEEIGGIYKTRIEYRNNYHDGRWMDKYEIFYDMDGEEQQGVFMPEMRGGLNWIRDNTKWNDTILCWWDYGHSVRGYTERNAVVDSPSRSLENTIYDSSTIRRWEDEERIRDVAKGLVATDVNDTLDIMQRYGSEFLITTQRDSWGITYALFHAAGLDSDEYLEPPTGGIPTPTTPTEKGRETLIYRIWAGDEIEGLELMYSDINVRVYGVGKT